MSDDYVTAAMVACPRCGAATGSPCTVRACRNGYRNCDFKVCSYRRELPEPHLERAVAARQLEVSLRRQLDAAVRDLAELRDKIAAEIEAEREVRYPGNVGMWEGQARRHWTDAARIARGAASAGSERQQ